jgi:hypothetical protein
VVGNTALCITAKSGAWERDVAQCSHDRALDLALTIKELQSGGCESLRAIAVGPEQRGIPAAGGGKWSAVQVARVLEAARPFAVSASEAA